jgi:hypothetical protein
MSRWLIKADQIAEHLKLMPALDAMQIQVHRAEDLLSQVNTAFEKAAGQGVIIIKWLGSRNALRESSKLRINSRYSISLWTVAILESLAVPPDDLIQQIADHLHGFDGGPTEVQSSRVEIESIEAVPDAPHYQVHEIIAEVVRL